MEIKVMKNILGAHQEIIDSVKATLFSKKVFMVNIIGSPGSGKTTLLENTVEALGDKYRIAVIEGDVATDHDARRIQRFGIPVVLINTDGACHLEPLSIQRALDEFSLDSLDFIFVENVGNLVCPAEFDIGEFAKIAVSSVPEGHDKPEKYPLLFNECKAVILNKLDLVEHTDFDLNIFRDSVKKLNGEAPLMTVSCRNREGLAEWHSWLINERQEWIAKTAV